MSQTFTVADVAKHKDEKEGMYIIIDGNVYNVASFLEEHPGGPKVLKRVAGRDASKQFWKYHGEGVLKKFGGNLKVGTVAETAKL